MTFELFWNIAAKRKQNKTLDPLGLDALREAMADELAPYLTGGTRSANDYLWTTLGLQWAQATTDSVIDQEIFDEGFRVFESLLKQHWYRHTHLKSFAGVDVVKQLQQGDAPDSQRAILLNQRTTGMLGAYVVSLRSIGVVSQGSLRLIDEAAIRLLGSVKLRRGRDWHRSWDRLHQELSLISLSRPKKNLGEMLFAPNGRPAMFAAASALKNTPSASCWGDLPAKSLCTSQARIAAATGHLAKFEEQALLCFSQLLAGESDLREFKPGLKKSALAVLRHDPFPDAWPPEFPLRAAMSKAWHALADDRDSAETLFELHRDVVCKHRQKPAWLTRLGSPSEEREDWQPNSTERDFRFHNLRTLVHETRWKAP